jgi:hypothetical protein
MKDADFHELKRLYYALQLDKTRVQLKNAITDQPFAGFSKHNVGGHDGYDKFVRILGEKNVDMEEFLARLDLEGER